MTKYNENEMKEIRKKEWYRETNRVSQKAISADMFGNKKFMEMLHNANFDERLEFEEMQEFFYKELSNEELNNSYKQYVSDLGKYKPDLKLTKDDILKSLISRLFYDTFVGYRREKTFERLMEGKGYIVVKTSGEDDLAGIDYYIQEDEIYKICAIQVKPISFFNKIKKEKRENNGTSFSQMTLKEKNRNYFKENNIPVIMIYDDDNNKLIETYVNNLLVMLKSGVLL